MRAWLCGLKANVTFVKRFQLSDALRREQRLKDRLEANGSKAEKLESAMSMQAVKLMDRHMARQARSEQYSGVIAWRLHYLEVPHAWGTGHGAQGMGHRRYRPMHTRTSL